MKTALRRLIHDLRLYYKSRALFTARLARPTTAWSLPFQPPQREVQLNFISARRLKLRAGSWRLLPVACRLDAIGAEVELLDDSKLVRIAGVTLYSPLWSRAEAQFYKEVFLDDSYGLRDRDLSGQVVVDIGAYVGDSVVAFAQRGATVHAVEPSVGCVGFIRRNIEANGVAARVVIHPVGLAEKQTEIAMDRDRLYLVEGIAYTLQKLPPGVDILKIDCEGAEYYLLDDPRFLGHLHPREIRMEYHRGRETILQRLAEAGYSARVISEEPNGKVGLIEAVRSAAMSLRD